MSDVSAIIIHIGKFSLQIQQSILVWLGICVFFAFFFYFAGKKIEAQDPSKSSKGIVYICEEMYNLVLYVIKDNLRETIHSFPTRRSSDRSEERRVGKECKIGRAHV